MSKITPIPIIQIIILAALSSQTVIDFVSTAVEVNALKIGEILFAKVLKIVKAIRALIMFVAKRSATPESGK